MHLLNKRAAAVLASSFVLALVLLAPPVTQGDEWNLATRFTVNQQTEVPGLTLEANTPYVIQLYDSPSVRHVVQIYNGDHTNLLTMFMGIRSERLEPKDDTVFTFIEMQPGHPLPIKEWFYPGRLSGLEFIYPKEQAERIAAHRRDAATTATAQVTPAPAVEEEAAVAIEEPFVEEQAEVESEIAQAELPPDVPSEDIEREKPVEEAVTEPIESEEPVAEAEETPSELPATAGELPLIGLLGMLCLGAGLGLRVLSAKNQ